MEVCKKSNIENEDNAILTEIKTEPQVIKIC